MKVRGQLLAILLSAAMVVTMAPPVWAEEGDTVVTATQDAAADQTDSQQAETVAQPAEEASVPSSTEAQTSETTVTPTSAPTMEPSVAPTVTPTAGSAENSNNTVTDGDTNNAQNSSVTQNSSAEGKTQTETEENKQETSGSTEPAKGESSNKIDSVQLSLKKNGGEVAIPDSHKLTLTLGNTDSYVLSGTVLSSSGASAAVSYHTDAEDILSVDTDGKLTLKKAGTARVWAEADGVVSEKLIIQVTEAPTLLLASAAETEEDWTAVNHLTMFSVVTAKMRGSGTSRTLSVTLSGKGYDYLFKGTTAQAKAADQSSLIPYYVSGKAYAYDIPVSESENVIPISAHSSSRGTWYGRQFTLDWSSHTITVDNAPAAEQVSVTFSAQDASGKAVSGSTFTVTGSDGKTVGVNADGSYTLTVGSSYQVKASAAGYADSTITYKAESGKTTGVVTLGAAAGTIATDELAFTSLADGEYTNTTTSKSGGLHDTTAFSVSKVRVSGGKAYADITWKSHNRVTHFLLGYVDPREDNAVLYDPDTNKIGSAYTDYCYDAVSTEKDGYYYSTATIPVQLGSAFVLSVRYPDAMSTPYWAKYDVTIEVKTEEAQTQKVQFTAKNAEGAAISSATITVTGQDGNVVTPGTDGSYTLKKGSTYHVTAKADGYQDASLDYTVTADASVPITMTRAEAGTTALKVTNKAKMFTVVSAYVTGSGSNRTLVVALSAQGYHYLFKGSTTAAASSSADQRIKYTVNGSGKYEFRIPVSTSETTFDVSSLSAKQQKWYSRKFTINWSASTLLVENGSGETVDDKKPAGFSDNTNDKNNAGNRTNTTEDQRGATSGSSRSNGYVFRWSGGSGRAVITCLNVFEKNGQLYATIHFSRANGGTSAYTQVRSLGQTVSGSNTFTIPVNKNANTTIEALTTAMSAAHWITYTLYIGEENGSGDNSLAANTKTLDQKAPEITGLKAKGEMDITYSDRIKVFSYENDIYLIEVDMMSDTARKEDTSSQTDDAASTDSKQTSSSSTVKGTEGQSETDEEVSASSAKTGEGENIISDTSASSDTTEIYSNQIVKYLVVPKDTEVPAGLDKDVIIVRQPTDKTYVTSPEALQMLSDLGKTADIKAIGLDDEETKAITDDSVKTALEKKDGEDGKIYQAGTYDKWDLKTLIKQEADFAVESSEILPQAEKTVDDDMKTFKKLASQAVQMDMPMFVDRSADEKNDLAKAEWYKVYGILFDAQDKANELYKKAVDSATEQEKQDALKALTAETKTSTETTASTTANS